MVHGFDGAGPTRDGSARLVRLSAGREAARYIRQLIFDGVLRPGSRVPQGDVADALGISRIPVREAIVGLEREGVVTIVPHRGAFVAPFDADAVRDHYELFGLVYGFAAQRTSERVTPEVLSRLTDAQRKLSRAHEPEDMLKATYEWNDIILQTGGSPRMRALLEMMTGILPGNIFAIVPGAIDVGKRGTAAVLKAIRQRDPQGAFDACRDMMRGYGERVLKFLDDRDLFHA